jgi:mannose-6-phosphate isomerase-like protein (cupin superfamily)
VRNSRFAQPWPRAAIAMPQPKAENAKVPCTGNLLIMAAKRLFHALPILAVVGLFSAAHPDAALAKVDVITLAEQPWYEAEDKAVAREYASPRNSSAKTISVADIKVPVGVTIKPHHHPWEEVYIVEAGTGLMMVGDETRQVSAGQSIVVHPGDWHNISNNGKEELRLTVICSPAWRADGLNFEKPKKP